MNPCELTAFVTAIANALANQLSDDELNLLGAVVTQLGDTLLTIAAQRSICGGKKINAGAAPHPALRATSPSSYGIKRLPCVKGGSEE